MNSISGSRSAHARTTSDADWYMLEQHEANPLLDLVAQTRIDVLDSFPVGADSSGDEDFSVVETTRPSFAQVAALSSAGSSVHQARQHHHHHHPSPIASPVMRSSGTSTSTATAAAAARSGDDTRNKYGTEYTLKKSGKNYLVVKS